MPSYFKCFFFTSLSIFFSCNNNIQYPDGGYDYPAHVDDKDTNFYYYPLKDKLSRKDSFENADDYRTYQTFHEPNISLKPAITETIRFFYTGWGELPLLITITKNTIIVKRGYPGYDYVYDETKLSDLEKKHLRILQRDFPLEKVSTDNRRKKYIDSMAKLYPQLFDVNYYESLIKKRTILKKIPFTYTEKKKSITNTQFDNLIKMINSSDYWQLPFEIECKETITEGSAYQLEVSTQNKYNIVRGFACPDDTSKFVKTCQQIINLAQLDKKVNLIWQPSKMIVQDSVVLPDIKMPEDSKRPK
jgi:hypothetical protein